MDMIVVCIDRVYFCDYFAIFIYIYSTHPCEINIIDKANDVYCGSLSVVCYSYGDI